MKFLIGKKVMEAISAFIASESEFDVPNPWQTV